MRVENAIPHNLDRLRMERGMTITTLADKAGLSMDYLWKILHTGECHMRGETAYALAKALNVTMEQLVEGADE